MTTKGAQCLANLGGSWERSTVLRCNEDGTFDVVPTGKEDAFMAEWQGVTPDELLFDDAEAWPAVFDTIRGGAPTIDSAAARAAFETVGMTCSDEQWEPYWARLSSGQSLDQDRAYEFFVKAGTPARVLAKQKLDPSRELFKLYWNQVRMGGRDPSEIDHAITIADTLRVLHLDSAPEDPEAHAAMVRFETRHAIKVPATLEALFGKTGVLGKILDSHCNNPEPQSADHWELRGHEGRHAVRIMLPHQGDHAWWAVFDAGAADGEIWISFEEDGAPVRRVARSIAFFFWDLAETGRCWNLGEGST